MARTETAAVLLFIAVAVVLITYVIRDPVVSYTQAVDLQHPHQANVQREIQMSPVNRAGGYSRALPTMLAGSHRPIPTGGLAPSGMPFQGHGIYPGLD